MKKTSFSMLLLSVLILCMAGCGKKQEEQVMKAIYITFGEDQCVFIEPETETVFYATFPEEIYDISGKKITKEELVGGNLIEITGNGVMAESFPGQYHGVTKMEIIDEGSPADADQYQYIIDQIYQEPDLSLPPDLSISYKTDIAAVSIMASTSADDSHILKWTDLIDAIIMEPTVMDLNFSRMPSAVSVERYPEEMWLSGEISSEELAGEIVEVAEVDEGWEITAEPGYVYLINALWEQGEKEYGFYTPDN